MNPDQIFHEATLKCKKGITREFIAEIVAADKTNTIKKYLGSYGIIQLALHLQKIAKSTPPQRMLPVSIDSGTDIKQKGAQDFKKRHAKSLEEVYGVQSGQTTFKSAFGTKPYQGWAKPKQPKKIQYNHQPLVVNDFPESTTATYTWTSASAEVAGFDPPLEVMDDEV